MTRSESKNVLNNSINIPNSSSGYQIASIKQFYSKVGNRLGNDDNTDQEYYN
jgi:hypothetical protein